jgi:hypothetical protein
MGQHSIEVEHAERLVRVTYGGDLDLRTIMGVVTEARRTAYGLGFVLLYDFTECTVGVSLSGGNAFPQNLAILQEPAMRKMRVALVVPPERDRAFWDFYETSAVNAGLTLRVFGAEGDALRWLRSAVLP